MPPPAQDERRTGARQDGHPDGPVQLGEEVRRGRLQLAQGGTLAQSLTFGVTTVLDMFSQPGLVASAKEQAGSRPDLVR